jgi:hypothetical protein
VGSVPNNEPMDKENGRSMGQQLSHNVMRMIADNAGYGKSFCEDQRCKV